MSELFAPPPDEKKHSDGPQQALLVFQHLMRGYLPRSHRGARSWSNGSVRLLAPYDYLLPACTVTSCLLGQRGVTVREWLPVGEAARKKALRALKKDARRQGSDLVSIT